MYYIWCCVKISVSKFVSVLGHLHDSWLSIFLGKYEQNRYDIAFIRMTIQVTKTMNMRVRQENYILNFDKKLLNKRG